MSMDPQGMDIIFTGNAVFDSPEETNIKRLIERTGSVNRENYRMSCGNEGNEERFNREDHVSGENPVLSPTRR